MGPPTKDGLGRTSSRLQGRVGRGLEGLRLHIGASGGSWMGEVAEFKTPEILKTEQVIYIYTVYIYISQAFLEVLIMKNRLQNLF